MKNKDYPYTKRITLGIDEETGKEIRKRIYATSVKNLPIAAYEAKREWEEEQRQKKYAENTFEYYKDKWLHTEKDKRSIRTKEMYEFNLKKLESLNKRLLNEIVKSDLQLIINDNWEHPRVCEQLQLTLRQIFDFAIEDGLLTKNPAKRLSLPIPVKTERKPLTKEEINATKNADLDPVEHAFVNILFYAGLRPEESRALQKKCIDLDNGVIHITQAITWDKNAGILKETKNHKNRNIPISAALRPILTKYIKKMNSEDWLFGRSKKEYHTRSSFKYFTDKIFSKINEKLDDDNKIVKKELYRFRHTFCTQLYYEGVKPGKISVLKAAEIAGHTVEVFLKTYCHISDDKEAVQEVIDSIKM